MVCPDVNLNCTNQERKIWLTSYMAGGIPATIKTAQIKMSPIQDQRQAGVGACNSGCECNPRLENLSSTRSFIVHYVYIACRPMLIFQTFYCSEASLVN